MGKRCPLLRAKAVVLAGPVEKQLAACPRSVCGLVSLAIDYLSRIRMRPIGPQLSLRIGAPRKARCVREVVEDRIHHSSRELWFTLTIFNQQIHQSERARALALA